MKKTLSLLILFSLFSFHSFSQSVGINYTGSGANSNALLDVSVAGGAIKGMLIPRMTYAERTAMTFTVAAQGLEVYQTDDKPDAPQGFYYNTSTTTTPSWIYLVSSSGISSKSAGTITGGTGGIVTTSGPYTIHTFTTSGTFTPNGVYNIEYLVVAGGGGGQGGTSGYGAQGGGGAGGVLTGTTSVTAPVYTISVGNGGNGGTGVNGASTGGNNSSISTIATAIGGGRGGSNGGAGGAGGSGGGAGTNNVNGGAGTAGQGNNGGGGNASGGASGGGAGGAGEAMTAGGDGGVGIASSISGSSVYYGGGGATGGGVGGNGGGGNAGGTGTANGTAGTPNTGGGGGSGGYGGSTTGGAGGTGVVIVRYLTEATYPSGIGIGTSTPSAQLHLAPGTSVTATAPLKFSAGTNLQYPENGATEYDGSDLFFTPSSLSRKTIWMGGNAMPTATVTGTMLRADGTNWVASTNTYPNTTTANQVLYATGTNAIGSSSNLGFNGTSLAIGALAPLGSEVFSIQQNQNGFSEATIWNTTNGAASRVGWRAYTNGNLGFSLIALAPSFTTSGMQVASTTCLLSSQLAGMNIGTFSSTQLGLYTANLQRLQINNTGEVGIGVNANSTYKLFVENIANSPTILMVNNSSSGAAARTEIAASNGTSQGRIIQYGTGLAAVGTFSANTTYLNGTGVGGVVVGASDAAGTVRFVTGGSTTEKARINTTGELGIGKIATANLPIDATLSANARVSGVMTNGTSGTAAYASWDAVNSSAAGWLQMGVLSSGYTTNGVFAANGSFLSTAAGSQLAVGTISSAPLLFYTGGASGERARFLSTGEFVLGATSLTGAEKFSVQNNQNALTYGVVSNTTSGTGGQAGFQVATNGGVGLIMRALSPAYTTSGIKVQSASVLSSDQAAGLNVGTTSNTQLSFWTNNTKQVTVPAAGGMVVGTAALATNATDGFLYIPTCAGTPTGTPTTQTGTAPLVIDTTNNKLYIYTGGAWVPLN